MSSQIRALLNALAKEEYRDFALRLLPGTQNLLGVRLPKLRTLAKDIARGDWRGWIAEGPGDTFEETMLHGMVLGYAEADVEEVLCYAKEFLPEISNWSVCDSFCIGLKIARQYPARVWEFLAPCFASEQEFILRFGLVMLTDFYITEAYIGSALERLASFSHEGYYARMAAAWALSICYVKFPEKAGPFLRNNSWDDFTFNKALQKITESRQVGPEEKAAIRAMKR